MRRSFIVQHIDVTSCVVRLLFAATVTAAKLAQQANNVTQQAFFKNGNFKNQNPTAKMELKPVYKQTDRCWEGKHNIALSWCCFCYIKRNHSVTTYFVFAASYFNLLTPNVNCSGRTVPLTSKVSFYIFIQQIQLLNILNMVYTLRFFLYKMQFVS